MITFQDKDSERNVQAHWQLVQFQAVDNNNHSI